MDETDLKGVEDDYDFLELLGKGGFGEVHKVQHHESGKLFACKKIDYSMINQNDIQNLKQETNILKDLNMPNIISYIGKYVDKQKKEVYIVMELCEKQDLGKYITTHEYYRESVQEDKIWDILAEVLTALKYCHFDMLEEGKRKVIHRDIKPGNIFLSEDGTIKLGDFGIARSMGETSLASTQIGTQLYMAPELLSGQGYDEKVDIWAAGCVAYELAALKQPFECGNLIATMNNIVSSSKPPLPSSYSESLQKVINLMLEKDPTRRPGAEQLLLMIEDRRKELNTEREKQFEEEKFKCFTFKKKAICNPNFEGEKHIKIANKKLTELEIDDLNVLSLDCSETINLRRLDVNKDSGQSSLEYLNIEGCMKLEDLEVNNTELSELGVEKLRKLKHLYAYGTSIMEIDVSRNTRLEELAVSGTRISELDVIPLTRLRKLFVNGTGITEIDVSKNARLEALYTDNTGLLELDVSRNTELKKLYIYNTGIAELDVSASRRLEELNVSNTKISELNVSRNKRLKKLEINQLTELRVLYAENTLITELDISASANLERLNVSNTRISDLDVSHNTRLTELGVGEMPELRTLHAHYTGVSWLDICRSTKLEVLRVSYTKISQLAVKRLPKLKELWVDETEISQLDLSSNKQLRRVQVSSGCTVLNCRCQVNEYARRTVDLHLRSGSVDVLSGRDLPNFTLTQGKECD